MGCRRTSTDWQKCRRSRGHRRLGTIRTTLVQIVPTLVQIGPTMRTFVEVNLCEVCGHRWISDPAPFRCPKCKSRKWDLSGVRTGMRTKDEPAPESRPERKSKPVPSFPPPTLPDPAGSSKRKPNRTRERVIEPVAAPPLREHDYRRDIRNDSIARPHTYHSGVRPIPGCVECAYLAKD